METFLDRLQNFYRMNPLRATGLLLFSRRLNSAGPVLTFRRLCTSRHVDDLQSIAVAAIAGLIGAGFYAWCIWKQWKDLHDQMVLAAGLIASSATALGWAYQSGTRRLGAVDLFASEISVICRVCLIVDFAKTCVFRADDKAAAEAGFGKFTSAEQYTPVYDHNIADLQPLDFDVVTEVTRFYTYRKTMMDLMRRLAAVPPGPGHRTLMVQMIHMQYLMYASARVAIGKLIEFEPFQSECVINILCSELVLYPFLSREYRGKFQGERLALHRETYDGAVATLTKTISEHRKNEQNWLAARTTAPEMMERYKAMKAGLKTVRERPPGTAEVEGQRLRRKRGSAAGLELVADSIQIGPVDDAERSDADRRLARLFGEKAVAAAPPADGTGGVGVRPDPDGDRGARAEKDAGPPP